MMENQDMAHVEEGALLAWLDGELNETEREGLEAHIATCDVCAERRDALRFTARSVTAALEETDEPSPWSEMPEALREAARAAPMPIGRARNARSGSWRSGRRGVAAAAGLILVLAAGAYAIPGSPVRDWVADSIDALASLVGSDEAPPDPRPSSVSVDPTDGAVRVTVIGASPELRISVALSADGRAEATARDARFRVEAGLIEVRDLSAGELEVTLPADAPEAVLDLDGTDVVRVVNGVLVRTPEADASAAEIVLRADG